MAYQRAALKLVTFKHLGLGEGYAARIPGFKGLIVFGNSKAEAMREMRSALEGWISLSLRFGDGLPKLKEVKKPAMASVA